MDVWVNGSASVGLSETFGSRMTSEAVGAATTLVASKLALPPPHRRAIRRPRQEKLLAEGIELPLVLVAAPAGFGKTTLVTSWLSSTAAQVGWVSLGTAEDDPARFWPYVVAALGRCGVTRVDDGEFTVGSLSNTLSALEDDVVLVLDDYHCITSAEIHDALSELIEQRLTHFHLMLLTRSDPPFMRARWKANGMVAEVRARDLAFDDDEMALFLDDEGLTLSETVRAALFTRIGGWPAALRLVALWVSAQDDPAAATAQFASNDSTISDYLVIEVLAQLPPRLRDFLVQTSILSELCGPLCDAVTGDPRRDGAALLTELHRRDLFIQALDGNRTWVRYHPLFRELLGIERRRMDRVEVQELHRRACAWLAAHDYAEDAIRHGVMGEDWVAVRGLMLAETLSIGTRYPAATVEGWLAALPPEILQTSAFFLMLRGYVLATMGRIEAAKVALAASRASFAVHGEDVELPELVAIVHAIGAGIARLECDLDVTRRETLAVDVELARLGAGVGQLAPMAQAIGATALAGALFWHGDIVAAEQLLETTEALTEKHQLHRMRVNALGLRSLVLAATGRLREAEPIAQLALGLAEPLGVARSFQASPARLAIAMVSMQRGDRERALEQLTVLSARSRQHGDRGPFVAAAVLAARLHAEAGRLTDAFTALGDAISTWSGWRLPGALRAMVSAEEVRLSILAGDTGAARVIASQNHPDSALADGDVPAVRLAAAGTQARLLMADGQPAAAAALYVSIAKDAVADRSLLTAVDACVAAAVAAVAANEPAQARSHLDRGVELAEDEGIVAPFVAHGDTVRTLLLSMESGHGAFARAGFRRRLLERLGVPGRRAASPGNVPSGTRLSERESAVLRLLRGRRSNAEIASDLHISPNTLKTHIRNLHRKLGAENRHEVLVRADELDLI
jgi:LuxR family maltose regulon positive regulatory protein